MEKEDRIERQVTVGRSIEQVWSALTESEELAKWFGDSAEVDLRPGGSISFGWSEYDAIATGVVERIERPTLFSYRWTSGAPGDGDPSYTLVTFELRPTEGGTEVTVVESGLAALPDELHQKTLEENSSGWAAELADLQALLGVPTVADEQRVT